MLYLNIGSGFVVRCDDIIAICDLDNLSYQHGSRDYLRHVQEAELVVNAAEDIPRSIIITKKYNYLSGINSRTLAKRL